MGTGEDVEGTGDCEGIGSDCDLGWNDDWPVVGRELEEPHEPVVPTAPSVATRRAPNS